MANLKFTKTTLLGLEAPAAGKRETIYDTEVPKLALRMTHAGAKTFYVVKRAGASMAWVKLGSFPDMTVEKARAEAAKVLGEFASGANPAEARRAFKAEPTFSEFFTEYGTRHGEKKRAWGDDLQRFRDYLQKPLGNRKLPLRQRIGTPGLGQAHYFTEFNLPPAGFHCCLRVFNHRHSHLRRVAPACIASRRSFPALRPPWVARSTSQASGRQIRRAGSVPHTLHRKPGG